MKKNGFTLVEMVVILIFITIIALMSVPVITNMLKKGEDDKYNMFLDDIYLATEAYIEKYKDDYPYLNVNGSKTLVYMKDLVDEKLVSTNLVNPKYCVNDECIAKKIATCNDKTCNVDDYTIVVTKDEDGKYRYELHIGLLEQCEYTVGQVVFDEGYTGKVETFTPLCKGRYKLEVWGAQGYTYNTTYNGGLGGYSIGIATLEKEKLSIAVGGEGKREDVINFNGGGAAKITTTWIGGSGGGATHIAKYNENYTVLSSYNNASTASNYVYIVAGGGGSAAHETTQTQYGKGGSGGGTTGGNGTTTNSIWSAGTGATQNAIGSNGKSGETSNASFGLGGTGNPSGGGGGWYGGGAGYVSGGAGGGSGYISSMLTNASMESGVQSGDGHAKITYLGE